MIGKKDIFKIAAGLVAIYVLGGMLLVVVYANAAPMIFKNSINQKKSTLEKMMPEADRIEKIGTWTALEKTAEFFAAKKGTATCGYLIESFGKGYSGPIHMLIATDTGLAVKRIAVVSHTETPGLGDAIETEWFTNQFRGKTASQLKVSKESAADGIQAIAGATISSRAVTEDAVKNALAYLSKAGR